MNKMLISFISLLLPSLVIAGSNAGESSLSFNPPATDVSIIFLGNIFGVVDGVLHGSGSQMLGNLFGVFNSAVLALGGIIIMYTLIVSTMNTAHQGEMLGKNWSSIWIPMRSTVGLALLMPKASGYCLMQLFVMWVVMQGVGAADKIWGAALNYLNQGGAIIQAQMQSPTSQLTDNNSGPAQIATGASVMLQGQVCMIGLTNILNNLRVQYINQAQNDKFGPCYNVNANSSYRFNTLCNGTAIPDMISTFNAATASNVTNPVTITMPAYDKSSPYAFLNGICGTIIFTPFSQQTGDLPTSATISSNDISTTINQTRNIAVQQMFNDITNIAQVMVNNIPTPNLVFTPSNNAVPFVAVQQFGIPYDTSGQPCTTNSDNCQNWGPDNTLTNSNSTLLQGTELQGAMLDYDNVMTPSLTLLSEFKHQAMAKAERDFITGANSQGWLMAGSYFFKLVQLNTTAMQEGQQYDSNSGLGQSYFTTTNGSLSYSTLKGYTQNSGCPANDDLCHWLNPQASSTASVGISLLQNLDSLIGNTNIPSPGTGPTKQVINPVKQTSGSTVTGYINNSFVIQGQQQVGETPTAFTIPLSFNLNMSGSMMQPINFPCFFYVNFVDVCFGTIIADILYNKLILFIVNNLFVYMEQIINKILYLVVVWPLLGMIEIFQQGLSILQGTPPDKFANAGWAEGNQAYTYVNPIVALANMGVYYINFATSMWFQTLINSLLFSALGNLEFIYLILAFIFPLIIAWLGVMTTIGFITAYYIPFLPYMIFTFGSIAWIITVIEAMVAAPIVALGVTHPEGHEAFGKGEKAIMILMNVFLRPSMMIIGYISAIALSYVAVWILNTGFTNVASFIVGANNTGKGVTTGGSFEPQNKVPGHDKDPFKTGGPSSTQYAVGYPGWAGIYGYFFCIIMYTTLYLLVVQKSFTLINVLPDKVLRWIGEAPEGVGEESSRWAEEAKGQVKEGTQPTMKAMGQMGGQLGAAAAKWATQSKKEDQKGAGFNIDSAPATKDENKENKND